LTPEQKESSLQYLKDMLEELIMLESTKRCEISCERGLHTLFNRGIALHQGYNGTYTIKIEINGGARNTEI
jgi:hypothetical protein